MKLTPELEKAVADFTKAQADATRTESEIAETQRRLVTIESEMTARLSSLTTDESAIFLSGAAPRKILSVREQRQLLNSRLEGLANQLTAQKAEIVQAARRFNEAYSAFVNSTRAEISSKYKAVCLRFMEEIRPLAAETMAFGMTTSGLDNLKIPTLFDSSRDEVKLLDYEWVNDFHSEVLPAKHRKVVDDVAFLRALVAQSNKIMGQAAKDDHAERQALMTRQSEMRSRQGFQY